MTYIKLIFLLIMMMMDRCGIITPNSRKDHVRTETEETGENNLNGTWQLTAVSQSDSAAGKQEDSLRKTDLTTDKRLLSFFPDSTFTEINGNGEYQTGKYVYSDSQRSLTLTGNKKAENINISFSYASNGSRMIIFQYVPGQVLSFTGSGRNVENFKEDPYYFTNNFWRIKPRNPENQNQILNRLSGYIAHNVHILKAADMRRQEYVSWEFSKGIIKIYNGGIGIVAPDQIPEIWIHGFHSREDALKAYEMLEQYLRTTRYKGTATGNWVKDDHRILVSIYNGLKRPV